MFDTDIVFYTDIFHLVHHHRSDDAVPAGIIFETCGGTIIFTCAITYVTRCVYSMYSDIFHWFKCSEFFLPEWDLIFSNCS